MHFSTYSGGLVKGDEVISLRGEKGKTVSNQVVNGALKWVHTLSLTFPCCREEMGHAKKGFAPVSHCQKCPPEKTCLRPLLLLGLAARRALRLLGGLVVLLLLVVLLGRLE